MGICEMSQRDPDGPVQQCIQRMEGKLRHLLGVPDNYKVLFFQASAHAQFAAVPMNLFGRNAKADYINSGFWAHRAVTEAKKYGTVMETLDLTCSSCTSYPPVSQWNLSADAAYVHICLNETISGLALHEDPDVGSGHVLVADMTSSLLSRPVDVAKYGVLYASSGKNLGPAGVCVVIVRSDLLDQELSQTPTVLSWKTQAACSNVYNTPNIFAIRVLELTLDKLLRKGGLPAAAQRSRQRAQQVYDAIDNSQGFYSNAVEPAYRSHTAIPFHIARKELEAVFLKESTEAGLYQLFGHPSVGGLRVCIYNGLPDAALEAFLQFLQDFQKRYGG
ncbi:hypothetical protein WJX72_010880 [[Myrmecia] bisecta]|uniref:phosphoserine transaminase n=1 Tax=[Myrmecia] bisecta TaxID=41462 RepID=A0AAW1QSJ6_9CHLO